MNGIDTSSSSWGKYRPAELTVRLHPAELNTDWTNVFNDLDLKRPYSLMKDMEAKNWSQAIENVAIKAQEGDRMANLAAGEKNVFGAIAHSRYMRSGQKEITIEALPRQGVYIDFRIHPPEIHVDAKGALPR